MFSRVPGVLAAEVCARFGLSQSALRRARKELPAVRLTDDDLVQIALVKSTRPLTEAELISFIDWFDHARWSPESLAAVLARLEAGGRVRRAGQGWELAAEWP
jgi:hypothetical protein